MLPAALPRILIRGAQRHSETLGFKPQSHMFPLGLLCCIPCRHCKAAHLLAERRLMLLPVILRFLHLIGNLPLSRPGRPGGRNRTVNTAGVLQGRTIVTSIFADIIFQGLQCFTHSETELQGLPKLRGGEAGASHLKLLRMAGMRPDPADGGSHALVPEPINPMAKAKGHPAACRDLLLGQGLHCRCLYKAPLLRLRVRLQEGGEGVSEEHQDLASGLGIDALRG
mmetsp:Transcript_28872/g.61363  ORF Transcript_28872/g.61363 Transcript_28872/m.61363 type:complete len:225 (+) Transcript_28872:167-841(+)